MRNTESQWQEVILKPEKLRLYVYMYIVHYAKCFRMICAELKALEGTLLGGRQEEGQSKYGRNAVYIGSFKRPIKPYKDAAWGSFITTLDATIWWKQNDRFLRKCKRQYLNDPCSYYHLHEFTWQALDIAFRRYNCPGNIPRGTHYSPHALTLPYWPLVWIRTFRCFPCYFRS